MTKYQILGCCALLCLAPLGGAQSQNSDTKSDAKALALRAEERRPSEQFEAVVFGRQLTIGGELGFDSRARTNYTLDGNSALDRFDSKGKIELEFLYELTSSSALFLEFDVNYQIEITDNSSNRNHEKSLRRGQAWLYWDHVGGSPISVQLGRQKFQDKREWWWDELLDASRIHFDTEDVHAEIAIAKELGSVSTSSDGINPRRKDVRYILASADWTWAPKNSVSLYVTDIDDNSDVDPIGEILDIEQRDPVDLDALWLGARARGNWKNDQLGRIFYWLDVGHVQGEQTLTDYDGFNNRLSQVEAVTNFDVKGWAYDIGLTFDKRKWLGKPRFTIAYARAQGDGDVSDGEYSGFIQTGLQDNNGKFRGVDRFKYYGETLRPDLTNMQIWTTGVGFPLWRNSSVELLLHRYTQVDPTDFVPGARIRRQPTGLSDDIGEGIDLVIGIEEWRHLELELIFSTFESGEAYGTFAGETAFNVLLNMDFNF